MSLAGPNISTGSLSKDGDESKIKVKMYHPFLPSSDLMAETNFSDFLDVFIGDLYIVDVVLDTRGSYRLGDD
jgi:hypothetical protein